MYNILSYYIYCLGGKTENERGVYIIYFRTEYWQSSKDKGSFQRPEMKKFKMILLQHRMFLLDQNDRIEVFQRCHNGDNNSLYFTEPLLAYLIEENSTQSIKYDFWSLIFPCFSSLLFLNVK